MRALAISLIALEVSKTFFPCLPARENGHFTTMYELNKFTTDSGS
jgi:hypothetical protein